MYKWVIVGTGFLLLGISWGSAQSGFGAFVPSLTSDEGWSRTSVSAAYSINIMTTFGVGIFWGWVSDRWSVRGVIGVTGLLMGAGFFLAGTSDSLWQLYVFYGLLGGIGLGGTAGPLIAMVARWFPHGQGTAMGIIMSGFGGASALIPILVERLISIDGWQFGFRGLSFLIWGVFVLAFLLFREPRAVPPTASPVEAARLTDPKGAPHPVSSAEAPITFSSALRMRSFWALFGMMLMGSSTLNMIFVHLVPRAVDIGVVSSTAVTLLTVAGFVTMGATFAGGALGDRLGARKMYLGSMLVLTVALLWLTGSGSLWMLYVFAVVFGVGSGGWFPQIPVLTARMFGLRHMGSIYGTILLGAGVGGVTGPIIAGSVFDSLESYRIAFIVATGFAIGGALLAATLRDRPVQARVHAR